MNALTMNINENQAERTPSFVDELLSLEDGLSSRGSWLFVQLRIAEQWAERQRQSVAGTLSSTQSESTATLPLHWEMTQSINLWNWQRDCGQRWFENGKRGIAKVVTGAGKTVFAQHLIQRLQSEVDPELRVAIVVPTIVLMRQWLDSFLRNSNLPRPCIGMLGGGATDRFSDTTRVLICVLNSASALLPQRVRDANVGEHLLLVVDECHRATGRRMSRVFKATRQFSLGLSATPERESEDVRGRQDSGNASRQLAPTITEKLGPVVYELGVAEAVRLGILSTFQIKHYGLTLDDDERSVYEKLSRDIRALAKALKAAAARSRRGATGSLFSLAQYFAQTPGSALAGDANQYLLDVRRRKNLLYRARARTAAVLDIVANTLTKSPASKILVFHESINEVMRLYLALLREGHRVTVDHSGLSDSVRADSIDLFRSDSANVLVSARTLIEGFDVPSADVGIIAASSTSPRQRIQTIGRVLRRPKTEADKRAVIHTFYMAGTVDDAIYDKVDWGNVTGAEINTYYLWSPPSPDTPASDQTLPAYLPVEQSDPPRRPRPTESEVEWDRLEVGATYPGRYEGAEYCCDDLGNVLDATGAPVANPQGVPALIGTICGDARRFKITPSKRAILCWDRRSAGVRLVGFLKRPFKVLSAAAARAGRRDARNESAQGLEYRVKQLRGQRRIQDYAGKFALSTGQATDAEKGNDAVRLVAAIVQLEKEIGKPIRQFVIEGDDAYCVIEGQRMPLFRLKRGLEFK